VLYIILTYELSVSMDMIVEIQATKLLTENISRGSLGLDIS